MNFLRKLCNKNGIGTRCGAPISVQTGKYSVDDARSEAELVMFETVQKLLQKSNVKASEVDVLVTNCSLFGPTPSLSAMIVNKFKMRSDIHSFSLGGQGCSASPIGVDVIQSFLQNSNLRYGLLVSTENITQNYYRGNDRSMLLPITLFRMGCAAILFTNTKRGTKYQVVDLVRTHIGADDEAHRCIYQTTDKQGVTGVSLQKTITANAARALQKNMTKLFRRVLPKWVLLHYVAKLWLQSLKKMYYTKVKKVPFESKEFMPLIQHYFNHFCFHTGGRAVIDAMQKMFNLDAKQIAASKAALFHYGNTSSASIWYELAYHESHSVRKGEVVWQIAFGSGFKCNSLVLKAVKNVKNITYFDEYDKNYTFDESMLKCDFVDKEEQEKNYEALDAQIEKIAEEKEIQQILEKYKGKLTLVQ